MRFSLVDRIVELAPGKSVTAIKNVSLAEEYLADHFPGYAVLPGVMMLECLVQAGAWLMRSTEDFRYSTILLKQAKALKYNNFVRPGQTLTVTATVHSRGEREYVFKGSGTVEGSSAVAESRSNSSTCPSAIPTSRCPTASGSRICGENSPKSGRRNPRSARSFNRSATRRGPTCKNPRRKNDE